MELLQYSLIPTLGGGVLEKTSQNPADTKEETVDTEEIKNAPALQEPQDGLDPANSRDSRKADANRGCRLLSTGSSGRINSSGSFSQVIVGKGFD